MKTALLYVCSLAVAVSLYVGLTALAEAQADGGAPVAAQPAPAPVLDAPDPLDNPQAAITKIKDTKEESGFLVAGVLALAMIAGALSRRAKPGTFLDRGRLPMILVMAASGLAVLFMAATGQIPWSAAIGAWGTAIGTVLWPAGPTKAGA